MHCFFTFQIIYQQSVIIQRIHVQTGRPSAGTVQFLSPGRKGGREGSQLMAEASRRLVWIRVGVSRWGQEELQGCRHPWVMLLSPW